MKELCVEAKIDNLEPVTAFVDEVLEAADCPIKTKFQIDVAIDELFSNIAFYAYPGGSGTVTIVVEITEEPAAVITFSDSGVAFDPLHQEEPDTTLPAEEREIGGLGLLMVKKTMDSVSYERRDGKNILRIMKKL